MQVVNGLLMAATVLTCTLRIDGSQNPGLGRKSHGYNFWDADGANHTDFLEAGTTTNSQRYIATLKQQLRKVQKHRKNILQQNNNARPHSL